VARFKKDHSGNPSGRPKGITDRRSALRELLTPYAQELIQKAVELALAGDSAALRLCLERLVPPIRAKDEPVYINQPGTTLTAQAQAIVHASLTGQISPREAATLLQALAIQARVTEAEELAARIEALEAKLGVSK
jgi:Family of unknown function (DUF5681)